MELSKEEIEASKQRLLNAPFWNDPPRRFTIKRKIPCPKCGEPMEHKKQGQWTCENPECKVITANFNGEKITKLRVATV